MTTPPAPAATDAAPINAFSQCHVGIVAQLHELEKLPALVEAAAQARQVAARTLKFFRVAVIAHHTEEERDLFPAVLASAVRGEEAERVKAMVERLTREHRSVEARFAALRRDLEAAAKGHESALDGAAVAALVADYVGHARFEEEHFLPLAHAILSRNGDHMAALGMALHTRHALADIQDGMGFHV
jgi:hemerythrin-like domain-containing protein